MNFLCATVTESEFINFLTELCNLYNKYKVNIKGEGHYIKHENISEILASGDVKIEYKNIGTNIIDVNIFLKGRLKYSYKTSLTDEVHIASIFMGTELLGIYNKTSISDVNFPLKQCTKITFFKTSSNWIINIDIIS
jgi:hypothetical protein